MTLAIVALVCITVLALAGGFGLYHALLEERTRTRELLTLVEVQRAPLAHSVTTEHHRTTFDDGPETVWTSDETGLIGWEETVL